MFSWGEKVVWFCKNVHRLERGKKCWRRKSRNLIFSWLKTKKVLEFLLLRTQFSCLSQTRLATGTVTPRRQPLQPALRRRLEHRTITMARPIISIITAAVALSSSQQRHRRRSRRRRRQQPWEQEKRNRRCGQPYQQPHPHGHFPLLLPHWPTTNCRSWKKNSPVEMSQEEDKSQHNPPSTLKIQYFLQQQTKRTQSERHEKR